MKIVLTQTARQDLVDILLYLRGAIASGMMVMHKRNIKDALEAIRTDPYGDETRACDELGHDVRSYFMRRRGKHFFYKVDKDVVVVLRVL